MLKTAQGARWYRIPLLCRRHKRLRFNLWVRKIPWRKKRQLTPVFLPWKSHRRSRVGYSPWGHNESDVTEHTHVHTHTHTHTHTEARLTSFLKQWFSPPRHLHHLGSFSDPHSVLRLSRDHPVSIHTEDPLGGYKLPSPGVPSCPLVSVAPSALSLPLAHTWQFHKSFS